jgi:hypothetical protein
MQESFQLYNQIFSLVECHGGTKIQMLPIEPSKEQLRR